jgi:hypothetical protein
MLKDALHTTFIIFKSESHFQNETFSYTFPPTYEKNNSVIS